MKTMPPRQPISPALRQAKIRRLVRDRQAVSIPALALMFGVSEMTVRRDLIALEHGGEVRRTHGGVIPAERMVFEFDFRDRRRANRLAKQAIARKAAELVLPRQRIILDTGTTTLELASLLRDRQDLTVITPSLAVASELQFAQGVQTILLGGVIRRGSPDLTGALTEANLDMLSADLAFQGADGVGLDGQLYNSDLQLAKADRKMRLRASHTYILADSSKVGRTALVCNGSLKDADAIITDDAIDGQSLRRLRRAGANVIVAKTSILK